MTFGKFNKTLPQSSLEIVQLSPTAKQHLIKSKGFSFDSTYYDFPKDSKKSFVMIDPFSESNGYVTQSEERYNRTRDAFEYIWKNLSNNDALGLKWLSTGNGEMNVSMLYFPSTSCHYVNQTLISVLNQRKAANKNITYPKYNINMNEYNLTFNYFNFLREAGSNC